MADTKMSKSAGEHWTCAALSLLGWGAALTRDGLERTDILAVQTTGDRRMIEVQVKASRGTSDNTSWLLGVKSQKPAISDREWFVLIGLPSTPVEQPRAFIVPRNHVAAAAWIEHMAWQTDPTVAPGKRNTDVDQARVKATVWAGYENRWDLLDGSAYDAPVLLPKRIRELALEQRVGLPPEHLWHDGLPVW
ncbi:hypothetical protein ASF62_11105 [Leifsonia sp. Leaf325]|nr:hypothetical protein [Leifsonia sp. Leaf325]KQQ94609.1 hypothetical protein ASF62_11105 [Leifsonia sp. Leaf325]